MEKNSNTPQIRFRGCQGAWEHRKAASIFGVVSDKGHADLPILSASQELGMIHRDENGINMNYSQANVAGYKRVQPGEFVIHLRSFQGGFAHSSIEGITSPAYTILDFKDQDFHCDLYWKHVLVSEQFIKRLESITYGIRDGKSIKYEEFGGMAFAFPSRDEQERIAACFEKIDALVSRQRERVERLRKLKAALLDKLFPKPGHNTPELRVKGCAGEWEIVKANNVFANISDKGHPQLPVLSASQELGMIPRDETGINMSYSLQNVMSYKRVMPGQFVIHLRSFQGGFAHSAIDGITSPAYTVLGFKDKERHCDSFWKYILVSKEFIRRLENVTYGIRDGKSIKYEDFSDMEFQVPECSEQLAISSLLMKYDRLTSLHEAKLAKLQQLKLSLLDKMFV